MTTLLMLALLAGEPDHCVPARTSAHKIKRSKSAVKAFKRAHPCPSTCDLYTLRDGQPVLWRKCGACDVDHVCPLACCGADDPNNMQWLPAGENRRKGADCKSCTPRK